MHKILGALLGLVFVSLSLWMLNDMMNNFNMTGPWAPIATLAAAAVALFIGIWQQKKVSEREEAVRFRKNRAVRAIMPLALSELLGYAKQCRDSLFAAFPAKGSEFGHFGEPPKLPDGSVNTLKECIEYADRSDGERIAKALEKIQIQNARISALDNRDVSEVMFEDQMIDVITLYAEISSMYDYARGRTDHIISDMQISNSAFNLKIEDAEYPKIFEKLERRGVLH